MKPALPGLPINSSFPSLPPRSRGACTHPRLPITPITQIPLITVQTFLLCALPALCGQISPLTNPHPSPILEHMSANTHTTETTERKPPTIADIVREKTGDGRLIIDFFTDVMTGRIKGAELCHRIDAAKQLIKYGSKDAAEFIAKYKGVPCGHSINGRLDPADPCSAEDRSLVAVTLNAPATLTRDFLTVLSGIDEFLMARLIRAQTADGVTIIEFLDDVMQDRTDGFKTHHRIAAAKELIVHIVRDEQGSHTPSPSTGEGWGEGDSPVVGADPRVRPLPGSHTPSPLTGEGWSEGDSPVIPAKSLPRTRYGAGTHPPDPAEGPQDKARQPRTRRTRTQRRRDGNARAAIRRKALASERIEEEKDEKPAPAELTIAERRIRERLEQHWHEPDPYGAPIDSTHPGRSPP